MKVTSLNIPSNYFGDQLMEIKMDRLTNLVLLAGPNGAGKTRLLSRLKFAIDHKLTNSEVDQVIKELALFQNQSRLNPENDKAKKNIKIREQKLFWNDFLKTDLVVESKLSYVDFVPKNLNLTDCNQFSKTVLITEANNVANPGVSSLPQGTFVKIQSLQNQYWDVTHQQSTVLQDEKIEIEQQYATLKNLILLFMQTTLDRDKNGDATLFGLPLGNAQLSDGQKILLQFCIAIYAQRTKLDNLIILLDEPENHLHPAVLLFTLDRIRDAAPNTQIWISTHSLPLLAHFDPTNIWFISNGKIEYAGRGPQMVLEGLLGDEEEISRLVTFLGLPAQHASVQFALECLTQPGVSTETQDPQSKQITSFIHSSLKDIPLRILDYGAGKGRLAQALKTELASAFIDSIDYFALELSLTNRDDCRAVMESIYGENTERVFSTEAELMSKMDELSVDVVVMSNVFHEIDPKDWLSLFSSENVIMKTLKETGMLLIIEDHQMPVGEYAHSKGFLVLDTLEFKRLFGIREADKDLYYALDYKNLGRLKAHCISKKLLNRISHTSRKQALESLLNRAKKEIVNIRSTSTDYKAGMKHAFWVQQLANAILANDEM